MFGITASSTQKFRATRFSGTGYVDLGIVSAFNFERTDSFSIHVRVKLTNGASTGVLVNRRGGASGGGDDFRGYSTAFVSGGTLRFNLNNDAAGGNRMQIDTTDTGIDNGHWRSIVFTYDGTSDTAGMNAYVDTTLQNKTATFNTLSNTIVGSRNMYFGRDVTASASQLTASMDDIAVFSGVIDGTSRSTLYNSGKPPNKANVLSLSGLLGYWRMGEGYISTIPDDKNGNNGTLSGGLTTSDLIYYTKPF